MNYWLIKSEPFKYSWEQLEKDGSTFWDGVRNYGARIHLRAMKKGDQAFFYHSNEGKEIVGIVKITKEAYQDPTTKDDWSAVDVTPLRKIKQPVSLETIRKTAALEKMQLVVNSRLSVQPVRQEEWETVMGLASGKK